MMNGKEKEAARPARPQISFEELDVIRTRAERTTTSGMIYNIWYNAMSHGDNDNSGPGNKTHSETRCDLARDAGYTRADLRMKQASGGGNITDTAYCCIFFARGCCPHGSNCTYLHRLPRSHEIAEQGVDIFGREKHGTYRDDMGGVGSMLRVNRTLYVGRINEDTSLSFRRTGNAKEGDDPDGEKSTMAKIVRRHFSEWGEIERVRAMVGRGIAFVTYKHEANAQFAKEAMMHQSLDHDEVLNVRWSTDDPKNDFFPKEEEVLRKRGEQQIAAVDAAKAEQEAAYAENQGDPTIDWNEYSRAKRQRMTLSAEEAKRLDEENARGWKDYDAEHQSSSKKNEPPKKNAEPMVSAGLLSEEAKKSIADLRKHKVQAVAPVKRLNGLAAYASDSEED
ncbi:Pre-mRNA-splicing factor [Malassezia psittaci]|uniref:Pre-mRNA-splicing factor n=1 Tax=Malassezia psittaci TaxID=1821823 RepID=A0AAF0F5L7_9BASI|nr:Pre-mRNA-splicing factor [Malassezia psittaci]